MKNIHGACDSIFGDGDGRGLRSGPFFFSLLGVSLWTDMKLAGQKKKKRTNVPLIFNGMS